MDLKQGLVLHLMDVEIVHLALTGKIKMFVPYALPIPFKILLAKAIVQIVPSSGNSNLHIESQGEDGSEIFQSHPFA